MTMSLNYYIEKIKESEEDIYMTLIVIIVGIIGFGLGRLSKIEERKTPIIIKNEAVAEKSLTNEAYRPITSGQYVASKTGSSFYFPWCSGARRIKEANMVWFKSKEEAISRGYTPAGNCKGL